VVGASVDTVGFDGHAGSRPSCQPVSDSREVRVKLLIVLCIFFMSCGRGGIGGMQIAAADDVHDSGDGIEDGGGSTETREPTETESPVPSPTPSPDEERR
jgi:hypothetical protein